MRLGHRYSHVSGLLLVMCAAALWATVGVASELGPRESGVSEEVHGFARTAIAGGVILLLALVSGGWKSLRPRPGSASRFLMFGVCCAVFQVCLFRSFGLLGVTITVFLTVCLPPVLAMIWALWRRTERVSHHTLGALALAAAGLLTFAGYDAGADEASALLGLLLSIIASVAFVMMTQAARSLSDGHSPLLVSGLGLVTTAAVLAPVALIVAPADWQAAGPAFPDWRSLGVLVYIGLGPTALAYVCYCGGMARCRSTIAGLVASMIEPAVAAVLAFLILGESLTSLQSLGCMAMLLAMFVLWLDETKMARQREVTYG